MPHERSSFAPLLRIAAAPFALAAIAMILCSLALGPSLGFYFAGIVIAVTGLPPLIVALDHPRRCMPRRRLRPRGNRHRLAHLRQSIVPILRRLLSFSSPSACRSLTITRTRQTKLGSKLSPPHHNNALPRLAQLARLAFPLAQRLSRRTHRRDPYPRASPLRAQSHFPRCGPLDAATPHVPAHRPRAGCPLRTSSHHLAMRARARVYRTGCVAAAATAVRVVASGGSLTNSLRNSSGAKIVRANGRLIEPM